ncbi:protein of unknown function [Magnetospirillum sp. XM-1]|nr:protein of unknown function [Magnetospirillum sp. XM-1]
MNGSLTRVNEPLPEFTTKILSL